MARIVPEALRQILDEQYDDDDQFAKVLAQVFCNGASVAFYPDGSRSILPEVVLEVGVGSTPDDGLTIVETPADDWAKLLRKPPKETEIAVFPGNFGLGAQGKHAKSTWIKDDLANVDAKIHRGHGESGHRGGMRQATSRPVLIKLFNQSYKVRKYR